MKISGDRVTNWEFFRQQWQDYELGTGLEHRPEPVRLATLRSVMGKDRLEIFLNLELTPEERASVTSSLKALEETNEKQMWSTRDFCLIQLHKVPKRE